MFDIAILIILILLPLLFKYPEVTFGLFLVAGFFKADPRLKSFLPNFFDLTVFLGVIIFIFIFYKISKKKFHIPKISYKLFLPYLGLVIVMLISFFYTEAPNYGWNKFSRFITITTLATFGPIFLLRDIKKINRFLYTLIFISSLMVVDSIISFYGSPPGFRTAFGSNYLAFGRITGIVSLLIIYYFLFSNYKLKNKILFIFLLIFNLFGLLYSGGRAPVISFFVTVIILGLFSFIPKISIKQLKIFKISLIFVIIGILIIVFSPEIFSTLFKRISILLEEKGGGESIQLRIGYYNSAIRAFIEKPFLGLGIGGFSIYHYGKDQRAYPHNIFLEIGSELGIIGLVFLIFLLGFNFFYLLRIREIYKKREIFFLINTILVLFIFMFLNAFVSGDINDNRLFFVWFGVAYSVEAILKKEKFLPNMRDIIKEKSDLKI